uniref:Uncharacterized protein n=1 Tax=Ascaris lumbricoides TaxID=6252 RepID=A0A9J2Q7U5_ASCLU
MRAPSKLFGFVLPNHSDRWSHRDASGNFELRTTRHRIENNEYFSSSVSSYTSSRTTKSRLYIQCFSARIKRQLYNYGYGLGNGVQGFGYGYGLGGYLYGNYGGGYNNNYGGTDIGSINTENIGI